MGKSGTGKSTSVKGLNPKETVILNVLHKRLPFKGSSSVYNTENKNMFEVDDYQSISSYLTSISEKVPTVKNVVIDDISYVMRKEYFKTAKQTGLTY